MASGRSGVSWDSPPWRAALLALPAVAAALVYFPFLNDFFATDDFHWLRAASNPDALDFFRRAFTFPESTEFEYATPNWRPFVDGYFFVAYRLFGLHPLPYHAVNVALHAGNAVLLSLLIAHVTSRRTVGVVTGTLFAVAPTYDLVVTSIGHATELFATFFSLSALLLYAHHLRAGSRGRALYPLALLAFVLALMSRESAVVLAPVLLGMALVMRRPKTADQFQVALLPALPFIALAGTFVVFSYYAQYQDAAKVGFYEIGWRHGFENLRAYLKWLVLPLPWSWGEWVEDLQRLAALAFVVAGLALLVLRQWRAVWLYAWLVLAFLPFLFIREGIELRYTYTATAPYAALLAVGSMALLRTVALPRLGPLFQAASVVGLVALLVFLGGRARDQQTWFRQQSASYESLVVNAQTLCGPLPAEAHLVLLSNPVFDPYGINIRSAFNLYYERLSVHAVQPGEELAILAEASASCVVEFSGGVWERR
jgi:hypothetical protein